MFGPVDHNVLARFTGFAVDPPELDRRRLLQLSVGAGAGLWLGLPLPAGAQVPASAAAGSFNPFVKITPDNRVVVVVKHLDKGQGWTLTGRKW
jgi:isoquinoline 1-oxidoreductase subunit beta